MRRKSDDLPPEYRMTPEQENRSKIGELWILVNSDAYDTYLHDDAVSDPKAVDMLCRGLATLHMHSWAIIGHPEVGDYREQTARLVRCVKGIRHALRMLEPIRKPGEEPSFVERDLPRLQAHVAQRVGPPRGRVH